MSDPKLTPEDMQQYINQHGFDFDFFEGEDRSVGIMGSFDCWGHRHITDLSVLVFDEDGTWALDDQSEAPGQETLAEGETIEELRVAIEKLYENKLYSAVESLTSRGYGTGDAIHHDVRDAFLELLREVKKLKDEVRKLKKGR